jgi:hypothetical protein
MRLTILFIFPNGRENALHDLVITGAPTEITSYGSAYLLFRRPSISIEKSLCHHDHSWSAEAALNGTMFYEISLKHVKPSILRQAFYGQNL